MTTLYETARKAGLLEQTILNQDENKRLIERWSKGSDGKAIFLEDPSAPPLKTDFDRYLVAKMLESTRRELMAEANTTTVFGNNYVATMLGMVRQLYPRLIGLDLVSTQPMSLPTGKLFYLNVTRDDGSDPSDTSNWSISKDYALHVAGEAGPIARGMKFNIGSSDISIGNPRKLYVSASVELISDLRAYHNLDASDLLQTAAIDELARELDARLVSAVQQAAAANRTFTFGLNPSAGFTRKEYREELAHVLLAADNHIYEKRGVNATFILAGTKAALEIMRMNDFRGEIFNGDTGGVGIQKTGTYSSLFNVFRSRYVAPWEIIVGRRGTSLIDSGVFYLPYVPLMVTPRVLQNRTQEVDQSFMSRYGIHTTSTDYYVRVNIDPNATGYDLNA